MCNLCFDAGISVVKLMMQNVYAGQTFVVPEQSVQAPLSGLLMQHTHKSK